MNFSFDKLKEGIYMVKEIKDGLELKKIGECVDDLPDALTLATFEPHVYNLSKKLTKHLRFREESYNLGLSKFITSKEIVDIMRECLRAGE